MDDTLLLDTVNKISLYSLVFIVSNVQKEQEYTMYTRKIHSILQWESKIVMAISAYGGKYYHHPIAFIEAIVCPNHLKTMV